MNTGKELRLASWNLLLWIKYDLRKPALGECHTHCIRCVLFTWALPLVTMSQPGNLMIPHEWFFHITLPWGGAFGAGLMSKRKKMRALLYFRIRVVLACNAMFLSLSYSFHYRIIASYHHITASLTASESAICKEGQWYESRVRVNEFLQILRVNWVVVCTFTARWKVSVAVLLPQKRLIYINSQLVCLWPVGILNPVKFITGICSAPLALVL